VTINYGKRNPGGLTASDPGDTLYIPFATYNDSGASIGIGGQFATSDIEVLKNGGATSRATDSGYSLVSDTGQYGDRVGLHRFSLQIFNTADDTGFYDAGSHYHVAVDSIAVDGRTIRFFPAVFEIGTPRANLVEVNGDTGAANQLENAFADGFNDTGINARFAKIQSDVDTGLRSVIADLDTGLRDTLADYDTGVRALLALRDTGAIATAVWAKDIRTLTGWSFDTGVQQAIARLDTGLRDTLADYDTGIRALLALQDTGAIATAIASVVADAVWDERDTGHADTGTFGRLSYRLAKAAADLDTGEPNANVTSVNSVAVGGSGTGGDSWGPA